MRYIFLSIFLILIGCTSATDNKYDLVIANVNLIDGTGKKMQTDVNVFIKDGRIVVINNDDEFDAKKIIEGSNKYLIPGLFDCHTHTSDYQAELPKFIHYGVTSIFVTGGSLCTNEYFATLREMGESSTATAPHVFHTSQHFIREGGHPVRTYPTDNWQEGKTVFYIQDTAQISRLVKEVVQYPIMGIKLTIEDGPMPPPVPRMSQTLINKVVEEARRNNTEVYVHVSDNLELAMALEAGITNFLHYTGVDLDFENDKDLIETIYSSKVNWVTTLMLDKSFIYPLHPEWIENTDIIKVYSEQQLGDYKSEQAINRAKSFLEFFKTDYELENPTLDNIIGFQVEDIKRLYDNGVNIVLGTDTGNKYIFHGRSLHEEMQLLELGGMQPIDIIKMGTLNAAKMLGLENTMGSVEVGKIADMVLLDDNPLEQIENTLSINMVIKNGKEQKRIVH